jgi:hypothetical protein
LPTRPNLSEWLTPSQLPRLTGDERFSTGEATVLDFWRWALGDLRTNNARGYLAEFLVARALDALEPVRVERGSHDVTGVDGTRIEVKSSAFLQSWRQSKLSIPRFGLKGAELVWDEATGAYRADPNGRVDVWVFALHGCRNHEEYDPLDVDQWRFWTASNTEVEAWGQKTAGLTTIERMLGEPLAWGDLGDAVIKRTLAPS